MKRRKDAYDCPDERPSDKRHRDLKTCKRTRDHHTAPAVHLRFIHGIDCGNGKCIHCKAYSESDSIDNKKQNPVHDPLSNLLPTVSVLRH